MALRLFKMDGRCFGPGVAVNLWYQKQTNTPIAMDYEQDYTNLDIKDNGWYDDTRPDMPSTVQSQERLSHEVSHREPVRMRKLDNEDFD